MQEKRIPLAWSARWRRLRLHAIPVVCFILAIVTCGWLWQRHGATVHGLGQVDALRVDVTSPNEGLVVALPRQAGGQWSLYDHVQAGDVIARFDDRQLLVTRNQLRQEIRQLLEQIDGWQVEPVGDAGAAASTAVGRVLQGERSRLTALDQWLADEPQPGAAAPSERAGEVAEPLDAVPKTDRIALERLGDARRGIELRVDDLRLRGELLEVHAPISGTLVAVDCWPGQAVHEGAPIATIAADHGRHIVSFLPEDSRIVAEPGMQVSISSRVAGSHRITSQIERVGRQYERIPSRFNQNASSSRWGLPIRIKMPADAPWRPGALVEITYQATH